MGLNFPSITETVGVLPPAARFISDPVNAAEFGVKANGVHDDTTAMQDALTSLASNQTLILPPGEILANAASLTLSGVYNVAILGAGRGRTFIVGPDGDTAFLLRNTYQCVIEDLTYYGSNAETGWGVEFQADWTGSAFVGGVPAANNIVRRVNFGHYVAGTQSSFYGSIHAGAFGVRFSLKSGSTVNDVNNDNATIEDCGFFGIDQPISIEHLNSLWHKIIRPNFESCGGGVKMQGGSATVYSPTIGGAATGWAFDIQNPVGAIATPVYTHKALEVYDIRGEGGDQGLIRSSAGAGATFGGSISQCHAEFHGGSWKAGPNGGASGDTVSWAATSGNDSGPTRLDFFGGSWGSWFAPARVYAPSASSVVTFNGGEVHVNSFVWGGQLHFNEVSSPTGAFTLTPGLVYSERNCTGGGFTGNTTAPARQLLGPWQQENVAASQTNVFLVTGAGLPRNSIPIPRAASVTAIMVKNTGDLLTAGTLTAEVCREGGTGIGLIATLDVAHNYFAIAAQAPGAVVLAAGENVHVRITTSGGFLPTTMDIDVMVEIQEVT